MLNQEEEVWVDYEKYKGRYQVSNLGRVRSIRTNHGKPQVRIIAQHMRSTSCQYRYVNLTVNDKTLTTAVHRMVAESFVPNPDNKPMVNHIDGDKLKNNACNLEWVTCSENHKHAYQTGLRVNARAQLGKKWGGSSKFHNVTRCSRSGKWIATLKEKGISLCRKTFKVEEDAARFINEKLDEYGLHDRPRNLL